MLQVSPTGQHLCYSSIMHSCYSLDAQGALNLFNNIEATILLCLLPLLSLTCGPTSRFCIGRENAGKPQRPKVHSVLVVKVLEGFR